MGLKGNLTAAFGDPNAPTGTSMDKALLKLNDLLVEARHHEQELEQLCCRVLGATETESPLDAEGHINRLFRMIDALSHTLGNCRAHITNISEVI